jgi:thiamine-monophosphate kinase
VTSEFDLIERYFSRPAPSAVLGVGDDCALVMPSLGMMLAVSTDMLLAGRHFLPDDDPRDLGHKVLAVNLSDLAAMGADPRWATLALALPEVNESWLAQFADGFFSLAKAWNVELVGGDTNRGPLCFAVTVFGEVPTTLALRRDTAVTGDDVWLSGATGEAALALAHASGKVRLSQPALSECQRRLHRPEPRVELGGRLRGIARSAIDVSDGLVADLSHILKASGVGASLALENIPRAPALRGCEDEKLVLECLLAGGDDYELVFTAPPSRRAEVDALSAELSLTLTRIGSIVPGEARTSVRGADGAIVAVPRRGFDHFA